MKFLNSYKESISVEYILSDHFSHLIDNDLIEDLKGVALEYIEDDIKMSLNYYIWVYVRKFNFWLTIAEGKLSNFEDNLSYKTTASPFVLEELGRQKVDLFLSLKKDLK